MARDPRVETRLSRMGSFEYRAALPLRSIHKDPSKSVYQARVLSVPLNSDTVDLYTAAMQSGEDFPAPVLAKRADGTYDILGGFHRVNAALRAGRSTTDAYVGDVDRAVADRIARTLNNLEAVQGATKGERVVQARRLMELHGYAINAAAAEVGIGASLLEYELRAQKTQERLRGKVDISSMSTAHLSEMAAIHNDNVLEALATVTARGHLAASALRPIVTEVRLARTEEAALGMVRSFAETPLVQERIALVGAGATRKWSGTRRSTTLFRALNAASNLLARYPDPARMAITAPEMISLKAAFAILRERMESFLDSPAILRGEGAAPASGVPSENSQRAG